MFYCLQFLKIMDFIILVVRILNFLVELSSVAQSIIETCSKNLSKVFESRQGGGTKAVIVPTKCTS